MSIETATSFDQDETVGELRSRTRRFLAEHVHSAEKSSWRREDQKRLSAELYDAGLFGVTWPIEYGGRGLATDYQTALNEELDQYAWAFLKSVVTVGICAATLADFGTEEQKRTHLPRMLRGDETWTQLLSEPGAGSDLAGVTTLAVNDGDKIVLNGQKVWTSGAVYADLALALVRTNRSEKYHAGVSMVIVDMSHPGVDVRPLKQMTGDSTFSEVFLDDVVVPAENLVGAENDGWSVLTAMLRHERLALGAGTTGHRMGRGAFSTLLAAAQTNNRIDDPDVRSSLTEVYIQQRLLELTGARIRAAMASGQKVGPVGSISKIGSARAARCAAEASMLITGPSAIAWEEGDAAAAAAAESYLHFPMVGIAGGTTEIQKNTVAERILGLPRQRRP